MHPVVRGIAGRASSSIDEGPLGGGATFVANATAGRFFRLFDADSNLSGVEGNLLVGHHVCVSDDSSSVCALFCLVMTFLS